ncbi:MAG: type IV secretion system DNA-binding domain-containing protein [Nitrospirota bacterium]
MSNKIEPHESWEIMVNNARMSMKMHGRLIGLFLLFQIFAVFAIIHLVYGEVERFFFSYAIDAIKSNNRELLSFLIEKTFAFMKPKLMVILPVSCLIWCLYPVALMALRKGAEKMGRPRHIRGAEFKHTDAIVKEIKKSGEKTRLSIGPKLRLPIRLEPFNIGIFGRTGTGKTTGITDFYREIEDRPCKKIVYDPHGEFISRFLKPGDILFNPFDSRMSVSWNIFNEIESILDINTFTASLIPEPAGKQDPFWSLSAREVLSGIIRLCIENDTRTSGAIWRYIVMPREELYNALKASPKGLAAAGLIEQNTPKTESILSVLRTYTRVFEFLPDNDNPEIFSIRKWLRNEEHGNSLFITNFKAAKETLRPLITLFFDVVATSILSDLQPAFNRRIFIFVDEFATLNRIPTLADLLTEGRKFGSVTILGAQDKGSIDACYGREYGQKILNALSTMIMFSMQDPETTEYFSRLIGECEVEVLSKNQIWGTTDHREGGGISSQRRISKLVLPSDISKLKTYECYVKMADFGLTRTKLTQKSYAAVHEAFILRSDLSIDTIASANAAVKRDLTLLGGREQSDRGKEEGNQEMNSSDKDFSAYDSSEIFPV